MLDTQAASSDQHRQPVRARRAAPGHPIIGREGRARHTSATTTLILRFGLPAGRPAPPFRVTLRWRGNNAGEPVVEPVGVAGHRELRFRPHDASRDFTVGQAAYDGELLAFYEQLHSAGYDEDHTQAFCRLFTAICRAGLRISWDPRYKQGASVRERDFHDDLHDRLLADPNLGGRVERGSRLALGFLDARHDGITAEFKVERSTPVTLDRATAT